MMMQMMAFKVRSRTGNERGGNRGVARFARQAGVLVMGFKVAATAMMMSMVRAAPHIRHRGGGFKINSSFHVDPAGRALIIAALMMTRMVIGKVLAIRRRPLAARGSGARRAMMMLMMGKLATMSIEQPAIGDGGSQATVLRKLMATVTLLMIHTRRDWLFATQPIAGKNGLSTRAAVGRVMAWLLRGRPTAWLACFHTGQAEAIHAMPAPKSGAAFTNRALRNKFGTADSDSAAPVVASGIARAKLCQFTNARPRWRELIVGGGGARSRTAFIILRKNGAITSALVQTEVTMRPTNGIEAIRITACVNGTARPGAVSSPGRYRRKCSYLWPGVRARRTNDIWSGRIRRGR